MTAARFTKAVYMTVLAVLVFRMRPDDEVA
jgi:hypothetical protein